LSPVFSETRSPSWKRTTLAVVALVLFAFVQGSGSVRVGEPSVAPDLVLGMVLAWAYLYGPGAGAALGFAGGLALDSISVGPVGMYSLLLTLIGLVLGATRLGEYSQDLVWVVVAGLVGSAVFYGGAGLLLRLVGTSVPLGAALAQVLLPALVMDALVVVFLVGLLRRQSRQHRGRFQV